jgi:uncharacterized protein (DUF1800 family)
MRRFHFMLLLVALVGCASGAPAPGTGPVAAPSAAESRELLPDQQVHQVLDRLGFGARPGDVERVRAMGVDRWIALQLAPERIDDTREREVLSRYESLGWQTADIVRTFDEVQRARRMRQRELAAQGDSGARRDVRRELLADPDLAKAVRASQRVTADLQSSRLARAVVSERQFQEVMVDFWENHFSVFAGKGQTRLFLTEYDRDVIRPRALGHFRDLLGAVAKSPAMLFYLDNWQSAADSAHPTLASLRRPSARRAARPLPRRPGRVQPARPQQPRPQQVAVRRPRGLNENYARELMELHTLGVDGGYTQHDVIEVARALTGWSIVPREGRFVFRPELHDAGEKVVLGHTLKGGRGIEDGEEVLDILARHPSTAHFIAHKLAVRLVSDSPPPALVERAAQRFLDTDGDIREVVRAIVTSPEFFSRAAYRAKVKTPFELVASALRALDARPDPTPRTAQLVARLGQPIFGRQTPDGWPDRGDAWMNTGAILNRINFGLAVAAGRIPGVSIAAWPPTATLRTASREAQADGVIRALLGGEASPETRAILVSGENPLLAKYAGSDSSAMALADDSSDVVSPPMVRPGAGRRGAAAGRALDRPMELNGLAQVVGLALGAPEFQRR